MSVSTDHGEEHSIVSDVGDDPVHYGDEAGVVGLKGTVRVHVLDHVVQQRVHLTFLQTNRHHRE